MLINISNHPFCEWTETQQRAAAEQFGEVMDVSHPPIPPEADSEEVARIADGVLVQIIDMDPVAVHVMGEHTFCFYLVQKLQQRGVPCFASTTRRSVEKVSDNEVRRVFGFVRFRKYPDGVTGNHPFKH